MYSPNKKSFFLIVPTITPNYEEDALHENFTPDFSAFEQLLIRLDALQVSAILIVGTTGEFQKISLDYKKRLVDQAIETTQNTQNLKKIYVHISAKSSEEEKELANYVESKKKPCIKGIVLAPLYQEINEEKIHKRIEQIVQLDLNTPLYLYNNPSMHKEKTSNLKATPKIQAWIKEGKIKGIKDSTKDIIQFAQWLKLAKENKAFEVFIGSNSFISEALKSPLFKHSSGCVSGPANVNPNPALEFCKAVKENSMPLIEAKYRLMQKLVGPMREKTKKLNCDLIQIIKSQTMTHLSKDSLKRSTP